MQSVSLPLCIPDPGEFARGGLLATGLTALTETTGASNPLDQAPCILDGDAAAALGDAPDPRLHLGLAEQAATVTGVDAQLLVGRRHGVVLPFQLQGLLLLHLAVEQVPRPVDRPVAQIPCPREPQRPWRVERRVVQEIPDQSCRVTFVRETR